MKIDSTALSFYSCSPGKNTQKNDLFPTPSRTLNQKLQSLRIRPPPPLSGPTECGGFGGILGFQCFLAVCTMLVLPPELGLSPLQAPGLTLGWPWPAHDGTARIPAPSPVLEESSCPSWGCCCPMSMPRLPAGGWCQASQAHQQKQRQLMSMVRRAEARPS